MILIRRKKQINIFLYNLFLELELVYKRVEIIFNSNEVKHHVQQYETHTSFLWKETENKVFFSTNKTQYSLSWFDLTGFYTV